MKNPSTADSREPSGLPVDSATDPTLARRSTTHRNVKGETAPRLPHERDESSDSGTAAPPDPLMQKAGEDAASGRPSTDRGEVTDELYARTLRRRRRRRLRRAARRSASGSPPRPARSAGGAPS